MRIHRWEKHGSIHVAVDRNRIYRAFVWRDIACLGYMGMSGLWMPCPEMLDSGSLKKIKALASAHLREH